MLVIGKKNIATNKKRNKGDSCFCTASLLSIVHSVALLLHGFYSVSFPPCFSLCRSSCVAGSDRCAVSLLLFMKGEKKSCLVLHMSALFLELLGSWPHYTDLHTLSPVLSLSVCLSKLIAECR